VEDVDKGGEIPTRRAQQIAIGIEEKFFEDANQTAISVAQTQQVYNQFLNRLKRMGGRNGGGWLVNR
jgi:hypothetical protein